MRNMCRRAGKIGQGTIRSYVRGLPPRPVSQVQRLRHRLKKQCRLWQLNYLCSSARAGEAAHEHTWFVSPPAVCFVFLFFSVLTGTELLRTYFLLL